MSTVLDKKPSKGPSRQLNRKQWSAWNNGDDKIRVQINEPTLARTFAKIPGVMRTGYSVTGAFTRLYLTQHSRDWVQDWMKGHNKGAKPVASAAPTPQTTP